MKSTHAKTKKAKPVIVFHREYTSTSSEYTCPTCGVTFVGAGVPERVLRFVCDCGQELTVDFHRKVKGKE